MSKIIITAIGKDRPGIVSSVARVLFQLGCNIENVSQTILQSEFAGIYIVSVPDGTDFETFSEQFREAFGEVGLHVHIESMETELPHVEPSGEHFIITTIGPDSKGLVYDISTVIAEAGVNIINLTAVFEGGDNPEKNIMVYEVLVPDSVDRHILSGTLKEKAASLKLALTFQHKNIFDTVNRI
ncbi:ACT domain-containing protein [Desulfoluna sp.]|uniref:glycine cleavage system protein R n=1 Tax=Desulfoluna sp. TaxID=2045199 RepID=UPI002628D67B|nr:ACT domain-containing protein [Desulfoluna sp.]